jgi:hypothetical protein
MCRFWDANCPTHSAIVSKPGSRRIGGSFVYQQDGNVVSNRIDAPALPALEALPFVLQGQRLLANWADEHV